MNSMKEINYAVCLHSSVKVNEDFNSKFDKSEHATSERERQM
jgi:hypothetical protein